MSLASNALLVDSVRNRPTALEHHAADDFDSRSMLAWLHDVPGDISLTPSGARMFIDAAQDFVKLGREYSNSLPYSSVETSPIPALRRRSVEQATDAWSGFVPVGEGWLSLVWANADERATIERCLEFLGVFPSGLQGLRQSDMALEALASELRSWGIASYPAQVAQESLPSDASRALTLEWVLAQAGLRPGMVLAGARIVDCGQLISAPWTGALLATLGADVVSIAHPARAHNRHYGGDPLLLDLATPRGHEEFARLCRGADLVVDNFRARVWSNLELDPLALGARRHLRLPAFPASDSRGNDKCFGFQLEALSGIGHAPARQARSAMTAPTQALLDHAVGFAGATLAANAVLGGPIGRFELSHLDLLRRTVGSGS